MRNLIGNLTIYSYYYYFDQTNIAVHLYFEANNELLSLMYGDNVYILYIKENCLISINIVLTPHHFFMWYQLFNSYLFL